MTRPYHTRLSQAGSVCPVRKMGPEKRRPVIFDLVTRTLKKGRESKKSGEEKHKPVQMYESTQKGREEEYRRKKR